MIARLQTFVVVAIITVLMWIVAESASVRIETVAASIIVESTPEVAVRISSPSDFDGGLSVTLDGATARLDAVSQALRSVLSFQPGDLGVPRESGDHPIDLRRVLQASKELAQTGVRVVQVDPPLITVHIEPFTSITLPVKVNTPELDLDGPVQATPSQVSVRLPKSLADQLPPDAAAVAELLGTDLGGLPAGQQNKLSNILLKLPPSIAKQPLVRATPSQVDVALTLRRPVISRTVTGIPIILQVDPRDLERWHIEIDDSTRTLNDVTITGPRLAMSTVLDPATSQLRRPLFAHVMLKSEELAAAATARESLRLEARFTEVPSTLTFDSPSPMVLIHVRRRAQVVPEPVVRDNDAGIPRWPLNEPTASPRPD